MSITENDRNTRTAGRPTLSRITCRAGISPITVSRTLHGVASVAKKLAQKVRDAVHEPGYVANPAARVLAPAQSHGVAVLVPSLANLLFIRTLEMIHAVLRLQGLEVPAGNFHYSRSEEEDLIHNYLAYQPRGLLLAGFEHTENARQMIGASGIPCVYVMDLDSGAGLNCVGFSQLRAGEATAEHLLTHGRRRLAYIGAQLDQRILLRGEGFCRALQKAGCYDPGLEILTPRPFSVALGGELFVQLLTSQPQVDGVFSCDDDLAQDALLEALRRGAKVPGQIAVLGFNDLPGSGCTAPHLSSIRTPHEAIGRRAAEQLLVPIAGEEVRGSVLNMGSELMARKST